MKCKVFISVFILEIAVLLMLFANGRIPGEKRLADMRSHQKLVTELMLTDLSIWTEARYTRHPSQTDFFSPFQDFPGAIEHFPAGSIVASPPITAFSSSSRDGINYSKK